MEHQIEVGMEFEKAEKILLDFGAVKAQLQIRPEKSVTGKYMELEIYALDKKPYIVINHEEENGKNSIKKLILYSIKPDSKKNSKDRTTKSVDKIDLMKL